MPPLVSVTTITKYEECQMSQHTGGRLVIERFMFSPFVYFPFGSSPFRSSS